VFPIELDIDHPRWKKNLVRMNEAFLAMDAARKEGGIGGFFGRSLASAKAAAAFVALYTIPVIRHELPKDVRLEPTY
jgi:magnesium-protoporphyrin IX monomethyl ester (oxidative) cyclase